MAIVRIIGVLIVLLVVVILAIFNADSAKFSLFGLKEWQVPLILMLYITLVIGIATGWFFATVKSVSNRHREKKAEKKAAKEAKEAAIAAPVIPAPLTGGLQKPSGESNLFGGVSDVSEKADAAVADKSGGTL